MTLASALGTLSAPYPLAVAVLMGIIGAAAIFIIEALKIKGLSAIFFVLVFDRYACSIGTFISTRRPCISGKGTIICETMAIAVNRKQSPFIKTVPEIEGFPSIQNEIITLQKALHAEERVKRLFFRSRGAASAAIQYAEEAEPILNIGENIN